MLAYTNIDAASQIISGGNDSTKGKKPIFWLASSLPSSKAEMPAVMDAMLAILNSCAENREDLALMTRLTFIGGPWNVRELSVPTPYAVKIKVRKD